MPTSAGISWLLLSSLLCLSGYAVAASPMQGEVPEEMMLLLEDLVAEEQVRLEELMLELASEAEGASCKDALISPTHHRSDECEDDSTPH